MHIENIYYYFSGIIPKETCQKILQLGINKIEKEKTLGIDTSATTFGNHHKQDKLNSIPLTDKSFEELKTDSEIYVRDSEVTWFNEDWIYKLLRPYLDQANEAAGWKYDYDISEEIQFTKYGLNQFYGWHSDGSSDHIGKYKRFIPGISPERKNGTPDHGYTDNVNMIGKVRKLSMTVNLSEPGSYEGGNLKFDFGPHSSNKRFYECTEIRPQGSIIVFPSYVHHQVTPVTKGTRYSLVMWTLGKPFR